MLFRKKLHERKKFVYLEYVAVNRHVDWHALKTKDREREREKERETERETEREIDRDRKKKRKINRTTRKPAVPRKYFVLFLCCVKEILDSRLVCYHLSCRIYLYIHKYIYI